MLRSLVVDEHEAAPLFLCSIDYGGKLGVGAVYLAVGAYRPAACSPLMTSSTASLISNLMVSPKMSAIS